MPDPSPYARYALPPAAGAGFAALYARAGADHAASEAQGQALCATINALLARALALVPAGSDPALYRAVAHATLARAGAAARTHLAGTLSRADAPPEAPPPDRTFTVGLDLDDCALQYPHLFVPLLKAAVAQLGARIIVLTGNGSPQAAQQYRDYGYPEPALWLVHRDTDDERIGPWKAQMARTHGIDLLLDDFKRGGIAEAYRQLAGPHLGLQILTPPGYPFQHAARGENVLAPGVLRRLETVERVVTKLAVPVPLVPTVAALMRRLGDPDPHDPEFRGQALSSTYLDTPERALYAARLANYDYLTLRVRVYPGGAAVLEAKSATAKYREALSPADCRALLAGDARAVVPRIIPALADPLAYLAGESPLGIAVIVRYTRYAVGTDPRITLDLDLATDTGRALPETALLEVKCQASAVPPAVTRLGLLPYPISKFLWAMSPG